MDGLFGVHHTELITIHIHDPDIFEEFIFFSLKYPESGFLVTLKNSISGSILPFKAFLLK